MAFASKKSPTVRVGKKKRVTLKATFLFDKKVALRFHDSRYYAVTGEDIKRQEFRLNEKRRLSTKKRVSVTSIIEKYKSIAVRKTNSIWSILNNVYKRNAKLAFNNQTPVRHSDLNYLVSQVSLLLVAYKSIRSNKGALTQAYVLSYPRLSKLGHIQRRFISKTYGTPDGLSMQIFHEVSYLIKKGLYPWGSSRRVYVPKPGQAKMRPITIPPFMDRIVQTAIKMVLETIYEPWFEKQNRSFGFRSNKGCHDAIYSLQRPYTKNMYMAIEGDIKGAYDKVNRKTLINILSKRIADKKFLKLIQDRLDYEFFDTEKEQYVTESIGIPQGGIDSPFLWNIYMNEFDQWIIAFLNDYISDLNSNTKERKFDPYVQELRNEIDRIKLLLKKGDFNNVQEKYRVIKRLRIIKHKIRNSSSEDLNTKKIKFTYARYADDFIILFNGTQSHAEHIRQNIGEWLKTNLDAELAMDKTLITNMRKDRAHFLGFELSSGTDRKISRIARRIPLKRDPNTNKPRFGWRWGLSKVAGTDVRCYPDRNRLINRLYMKGYCDKRGFPLAITWLSYLDAHMIVERFNSVIRGFTNYYAEFVYNRSSLNRWTYILRFSCLKTLALKFHTTISKIFKKFKSKDTYLGKTIEIPVYMTIYKDTYKKTWRLLTHKEVLQLSMEIGRFKTVSRRFEALEYITDFERLEPYQKKKGGVPAITDDNYLDSITWVNARTQASFDLPCCLCGKFGDIEMHHVKHIRKNKYSIIPTTRSWEQVMNLRNRKQIPVCSTCHKRVIHAGTYVGPPLRLMANPQKLYDNRIIHIESYVKPGKEYYGKHATQKGWSLINNKRSNPDDFIL